MPNPRNGRTIRIPVQTSKHRQLPRADEQFRLLLSGPGEAPLDVVEAKPLLEDAECGEHVSDLRAEVKEWREQVSVLRIEADDWKAQALALQAEAEEREKHVSSLQDQVDAWKTQAAKLQNRETDVRRQAEHQARYQIGQERHRLLMRLLGVADDLERALAHAGERDSLRAGVELTLSSVLEQLSQEGVEPIKALGKRFDPRFHEAVASDGSGADWVVKVVRSGYRLNEELLRPSQVIVGRLS